MRRGVTVTGSGQVRVSAKEIRRVARERAKQRKGSPPPISLADHLATRTADLDAARARVQQLEKALALHHHQWAYGEDGDGAWYACAIEGCDACVSPQEHDSWTNLQPAASAGQRGDGEGE